MDVITQSSSFPELFRHWRKKRNLSQLTLATAMDTTTRHISFLETGRSKPSESMILRISDALDIPFRERNMLFTSAGFKAQYKSRELDNPDMLIMNNAIDMILNNHQPFPGFVLDRYWNIIKANTAGIRMMTALLPDFTLEKGGTNMLATMFGNQDLIDKVDNWEEVAKHFIQRIKRESFDDAEFVELIDKLREVSDLPKEYWNIDLDTVIRPVIPLTIQMEEGVKISMLSTVTTFGTPVDVMAQEIRIELIFPADTITEHVMRATSQAPA